jgi:hypothetical protein
MPVKGSRQIFKGFTTETTGTPRESEVVETTTTITEVPPKPDPPKPDIVEKTTIETTKKTKQ